MRFLHAKIILKCQSLLKLSKASSASDDSILIRKAYINLKCSIQTSSFKEATNKNYANDPFLF